MKNKLNDNIEATEYYARNYIKIVDKQNKIIKPENIQT